MPRSHVAPRPMTAATVVVLLTLLLGIQPVTTDGGHGVHQPCGQAGAVGPFPEKAGTAASLSGFAMTLTALGVGLWLGLGLDKTVYPLTLCIGAFSVALAAVAWTLVQRHGEASPQLPAIVETQLV